MLETTFTTEFEQGPIPAGFPIQLEGNFIVLIGPNGAGKTSLLYALFRKNVENHIDGKTQVCLIPAGVHIDTMALPHGRTLEQYNAELAKAIEEEVRRDLWPNPNELPKLLLNHTNPTSQIQKLNGYLEYLGLPKFEIQRERDSILQPAGVQTLIAILAALTDDYIKMVLIDEPEIYLHPELQKLFKELLYEISKKKQIIIATHTNGLINRKEPTSNYFVNRDKGQFRVSRASSEAQLEGIGLPEVKLLKALMKAAPSIISNSLTSFEIEEFYAEKLRDTPQVTKIVQEQREETNIVVFYEELKESIKHTKDELATRRRERVQQTNISYYVSLVCLVLSVLLVFIGVILIFISKLEGGVLTTISSSITGIVSGLAFVFNKQINDLEREETKELRALEKSYDAMGYISRITDEKKRDELIEKLVEKHFFGN